MEKELIEEAVFRIDNKEKMEEFINLLIDNEFTERIPGKVWNPNRRHFVKRKSTEVYFGTNEFTTISTRRGMMKSSQMNLSQLSELLNTFLFMPYYVYTKKHNNKLLPYASEKVFIKYIPRNKDDLMHFYNVEDPKGSVGSCLKKEFHEIYEA